MFSIEVPMSKQKNVWVGQAYFYNKMKNEENIWLRQTIDSAVIQIPSQHGLCLPSLNIGIMVSIK